MLTLLCELQAAAPAKKKKTPGSEFGTSGNLVSSSGSPASNQGSPFLGVQAHKFMGSPSLALTNHSGGSSMKFAGNKSQASPASQQQKLTRLSSFPASFPPPGQQQQMGMQQPQLSGGYAGYQMQPSQQKVSPTHTISPPHTLYAQNPHAHQYGQQQGAGSSQGSGYHQNPLSPNNQFNRSFREGDLNQASTYASNNNGGAVKRHSFQGSTSEGAYYQPQSNYYGEILAGPGGSAAEGSTGLIGRRPSYPGTNAHLLNNLRLNELPPSPPKDGALYALNSNSDTHSSSSDSQGYSAFQPYRSGPNALNAPLSYPPQSPHMGGTHLTSPTSQPAQLQGFNQSFSQPEDPTSPRGDSFLRDFSKF